MPTSGKRAANVSSSARRARGIDTPGETRATSTLARPGCASSFCAVAIGTNANAKLASLVNAPASPRTMKCSGDNARPTTVSGTSPLIRIESPGRRARRFPKCSSSTVTGFVASVGPKPRPAVTESEFTAGPPRTGSIPTIRPGTRMVDPRRDASTCVGPTSCTDADRRIRARRRSPAAAFSAFVSMKDPAARLIRRSYMCSRS